MLDTIQKILYLGASLNIQIVKDFSNVKKFVFVDNQPRSKSDRYYYSDRDYNDKFIEQLINITKDYGFELSKIFILDEEYYKKILNVKKTFWYTFFTLPLNINPELYIFENKETNQIIKYYISTNIEHNMNYSLLCDIKKSDTLILNEYIPSIQLFDYFNKMRILIGYIKTNFSLFDEYIKDKSFIFNKYYLLDNNYNNKFIECDDYMDIIIKKIKIFNTVEL